MTESAQTAPRADGALGRTKGALDHAAHWVSALEPYKVVFPLIGAQWLLAIVVALEVGHKGSLAIVIPQVVVLLPAALVLVYEIAGRLGGRLFAAWSAVVWLLLPYSVLLYATPSLRTLAAHRFLPQVLGLTDDPRFGAMVAFAAAVYFTLRALETGALLDLVVSVAAAGAGAALAPREALIAIAPALGLAVGRRWRQALVATIALGALLGGVAAAVGGGLLEGSFGRVGLTAPLDSLGSLRENFWSGKVLEWVGAAGIVGALRSRVTAGAMLGVSFLAALLSVGSAHTLVAGHLALLQDLVPAWFAVALLVASIPLLVPRARPATVPASIALRRFWDRIHAPTFAPGATDDGYERAVATPLWASVSIGGFFLVMLGVGMWNATRAHVYGGYDAQEHITYAYNLIHHGQIPSQTSGGEFYTPPGFYAIAGVALWIGQLIGTFEPPHMALYLNALYVVGTGALLLVLARLLFPRRPAVWVAAVGFFAFLPAVAKTAGMFYPETLNTFVSMGALTLATWMLVRRRLGLRWLLLLGAVLAAGQLVRQSSSFTLVAIGVSFVAAASTRRFREYMPLRTIAIALAVVAVLASPWYARQILKYHTIPHVGLSGYWAAAHHFSPARDPYFRFSGSALLDRPIRPFFTNEAFPVMYTEIWGDWFGYWAWSGYSAGPSPPALSVLKQQTRIGILPTLLAIGGWLALWGIAVRRRVEGIPLLSVALLPLLAVGFVFVRAYAIPTPSGNLVKASYALTTAPVWALGFGVAVDWLSRRRLVAFSLSVALLVLAVLTLRFNLYGVRDHFIIF